MFRGRMKGGWYPPPYSFIPIRCKRKIIQRSPEEIEEDIRYWRLSYDERCKEDEKKNEASFCANFEEPSIGVRILISVIVVSGISIFGMIINFLSSNF
jgi:hypothetical protein